MNQWHKIAGVVICLAIFSIAFVGLKRSTHPPQTQETIQPGYQMLYSAIKPTQEAEKSAQATSTTPKTTPPAPYTYKSSECSDKQSVDKFDCLETYYKKLVHNNGIDVAFADLKKRYTTDSYVVTQCHPLTHVIGRESTALYPKAADAYLHGDSFCWSGYYHGVLEGIVGKIGEDELPRKIDTICADIPGKDARNFNYYNCVHGLGHGVMELSGDNVAVSLKTCDYLTGSWEQLSCYSGVFMENIIVFDRDGHAPWLNPSEPLYPCTAIDEKYKSQCYLGQTSFVLAQNGGDFKKTFELCEGISAPYSTICEQSIGRDAASYANHDGNRTKNTCLLTSNEDAATNCIIGAVKEFISFYHAIPQANAFCDLFSETYRSNCRTTGASYFTLF